MLIKKIIFGSSLVILSGLSWVFATNEDTQIFEQLENSWPTADDLQFNAFQSCDEMNNVLENYIKDNFENRWNNNLRNIIQPLFWGDDVAIAESAEFIAAPQALPATAGGMADGDNSFAKVSNTTTSSTNDFSTTNTQVLWIDEADILKSDGDYLYYYNQKEHRVNIIKTPLDLASSTINLDRLDVVTDILLPDSFNGIQMYRQADNLVIVSNRWRNSYKGGFLNNGNQVNVIVYDVSNPAKPALLRMTELDGNYHDSRLIGDKLYIINQLYIDRYRPMRHWDDVLDVEFDDVAMVPKNIDVAYTRVADKKNLTIGDDTFPYHISVNEADCNNIYYVLPSKDSVDNFGLHPSFTTVNVIDLASTEKAPSLTTAFGTTNTIHMAKDNLYLTQNFYIPWENWNCPPNARCIMPSFHGWEHTLIHKFNVIDQWVIYQTSTLANGSPLTQYSMDQWPEGNFRILTSTRRPERATHLYVLDDALTQIWSVENIEPGEEFKSSRYIWDKLYLVTFEQTDPLFVIDMVNPSDPKIIWELVIPGFSTYLHPYGPVQNNVQYLLGLGRDTDLNERWWTIQKGLKLDLYKIDYNTKTADNHVMVTQEYSTVRWDQWSQSEAVYNPRMFVWDAARKLLVLPMHLMGQEDWNQVCESERDPEGNIIREECRNDSRQETTFIWMKAIQVTPENGIVETSSFDYTHLYKQDRDLYNNGRFNTRQLMPRVWYVGDVLYQVNGAFGHFIDMSSGWTQHFLPLGPSSIDFDAVNNPGAGSVWWPVIVEPYSMDPQGVSLCLNNNNRTLYTTDDCLYCEPQQEVFEDYYAKLNKVNCSENQLVCSDANITWYPTRVREDGQAYPWYKSLEDIAELAWCA